MEPLRWKSPNRKRQVGIKHTDSAYVIGYDLDNEDFTEIIIKLKDKEPLTAQEDKRYGEYVLTVIEMVLENSKFKAKTSEEKYEMRDQMYFELCSGLLSFKPEKKSNIFSYAYRIAYVAGIHYFTNKEKNRKKSEAIMEHCMEELQEYIDSITDHKAKSYNKE